MKERNNADYYTKYGVRSGLQITVLIQIGQFLIINVPRNNDVFDYRTTTLHPTNLS